MLNFGNPWMLLGLLFAGVPVAIHLFGRRHAPTIRFAALAFILETHPREARALRVNEWLLVAVRALAVALVALALARPMIAVPGDAVEGIDGGDRPVAAVIVLDDSMSTRAQASVAESVFDRLRARALATVERLPPESRVAVVATGYPARAVVRQLTKDRAAVLDAIRRLPHRPRRDDVSRALALADTLLAGSDLTDRRVLVLTDMQASGWGQITSPWQSTGAPGNATANRAGPPVRVRVDRVLPQSSENVAIADAVAQSQADRGPDQVRLDVTVQHSGSKAWSGYLTVRVGSREWQSLVELAPGGRAQRTFQLTALGPVAEVRLPADALDADNVRHVRLDAATGLRVAILNGSPRPLPRDDEAWFLARALEASADRPGSLTVDTLQLPGLSPEALRDYDVLVLANIAELPQELLTAVEASITAGKGVLVTSGDNIPSDPAAWLPGMLPETVHGLRAAEGGTSGLQRPTTAIRVEQTPANSGAPAVVQRLRAALDATLGETLGALTLRKHALVTPTPQLTDHVVLRFADGAPALTLTAHGRGWVALLTTTADLDWSDLALQPGFLPLVAETTRALAGDRGLERRGAVEVGEVAVLARDDAASQLEVKLDTGALGPAWASLSLPAAAQHGHSWQVAGLDEPGRYTATESKGSSALTSRILVTVPPSSESVLTAAKAGTLLEADAADRSVGRHVPKSPAWSGVILILLVLLGVEGVLILRGVLTGTTSAKAARPLSSGV